MKTAGILITALILALTGNYLAVLTEKRIKTLECIVLMIKSIKTQISFARIPLIIRFGENLGSSDTNGQTENCNTFIEMLSAEIQHLKSKAQSKVKIYNSMGVLSAALVIILLS